MKKVDRNELKDLIREVLKEEKDNHSVKPNEKLSEKQVFIKKFEELKRKTDEMFNEGVKKGYFEKYLSDPEVMMELDMVGNIIDPIDKKTVFVRFEDRHGYGYYTR